MGRLAAGLAHEIGNPLTAILGFQELLLTGGLSREEERDFLEKPVPRQPGFFALTRPQ